MRLELTLGLAAAAFASVSCIALNDVLPILDRPIARRTFSGVYVGRLTGTQTKTYAVDGRVEVETVSIPVSFTFGPHGRLQTCTYVGRHLAEALQVNFDYEEDIGQRGTSSHSGGYQRISNLAQSTDAAEYDAEYFLWIYGLPTIEFRADTHFEIRQDGDTIRCRAERVVEVSDDRSGTADPSANFSYDVEWIAESDLLPVAPKRIENRTACRDFS